MLMLLLAFSSSHPVDPPATTSHCRFSSGCDHFCVCRGGYEVRWRGRGLSGLDQSFQMVPGNPFSISNIACVFIVINATTYTISPAHSSRKVYKAIYVANLFRALLLPTTPPRLLDMKLQIIIFDTEVGPLCRSCGNYHRSPDRKFPAYDLALLKCETGF